MNHRQLKMAVRRENQLDDLLLKIQTMLNTAIKKKRSSCTIREFLN